LSKYSVEDISGLLRRLSVANLYYATALARRLKLNLSEVAALEHLAAKEEGTASELAARLGLSSGAVTALTDRLERAGHLERHQHPYDRRSRLLRPTPRALTEIRQQLRPLASEVEQIAAALSTEERAVVGRFLEAVIDAIEWQTNENT
jgi:DNA-binding MarR family transcriptional regulator